MNITPEGLVVAAAVTAYAITVGPDMYREWRRPEEGTVEYHKWRYKQGDIDLLELERRLEVAADPEAERIRNTVEGISGIDEKTSFGVAHEFDTVDEVRNASRERLMEVPNVGEKRSKYIEEEI